MESMEDSSSGISSKQAQLPPGFRFHPTDEELVVHYLKKKTASAPLPATIIVDVDLYKFDPWELPAKATFGEKEWYFFTPRDRKYPNGSRPNRAATSGYWKATGIDKPVLMSGGTQKVGVKKALVFYGGKPPKGMKTNWIMHEYRLVDNKTISKPPGCYPNNKKASLRLDDWVLCRIYKKNTMQRPAHSVSGDHTMITGMLASIPPSMSLDVTRMSRFTDNHDHNVVFDNMLNLNNNINVPVKRSHSSLFWNEESNNHDSVTVARTTEENGGPMTSLMSHHQTMLGLVGDGVYRQPYQLSGMNWYS